MAYLRMERPNPKQELFLKARRKHVGFGGARGGGKSWSVRTKAKLLALKHKGIKILIVRRTYPELINNHIIQLRQELLGIAKYNDKDKRLTFRNGSTITFMYCAKDADLDRLQGTEFDVIFLDEAAQLSEYQMKAITACCRGVNNFPKRIYYTCNPGGQGHAYIKRIFIDKKYKKNEKPEDYEFIQSLVTDNKALMEAQPDYLDFLDALPPKLRDAWRYGRWDIFDGQVFEEFIDDPEHYYDRLGTHVIEPFLIPETWTILRGFDWGYSKPFSVGWYAVDHNDRIYRIRELYGCTQTENEGVKWTMEEIADRILEIESLDPNLHGRKIRGIADPAIFEESKGESIAQAMARRGVYWEPADHQRLAGKMQCHYRLSFDEDGRAMFYVFRNCPEFIRTIPMLMYSETKVEDVDTDMEDHIYDEWRYVMMEHPINREKIRYNIPVVGSDGFNDPLQMMQASYNFFNH